MKENLHQQLSALVDNELENTEQALLVRRLGEDSALCERLARYQVISDALQNHLPPHVDVDFHKSIQAALQGEAVVHGASPRFAGLLGPLTGLAVAASVAVVAVLTLQSIRDEPASTPAMASAPVSKDYLQAELKAPSDSQNLDAYLVNHNEFAVNRGMLPYVRLVGHEMNVNGE
jgi:sigma-E factor negative regulatory protein RseA